MESRTHRLVKWMWHIWLKWVTFEKATKQNHKRYKAEIWYVVFSPKCKKSGISKTMGYRGLMIRHGITLINVLFDSSIEFFVATKTKCLAFN